MLTSERIMGDRQLIQSAVGSDFASRKHTSHCVQAADDGKLSSYYYILFPLLCMGTF